MSELIFPRAFEENTRHASSFRLICENALAPLRIMDESFDPACFSSVLRGSYCLIVAGVDSYFTNFLYDVVFELSRLKSKQGDLAAFSLSVKEFLSSRCRVSKNDIAEIGVGSPNLDKDILFSKFLGVTFNKSFQFVEIYNLLFKEINTAEFWELCSEYVPGKDALWLEMTWKLVVDRRNMIMHSGDLDTRGLTLQSFRLEFVENAFLISTAVVSVFEKQIKGYFRSSRELFSTSNTKQ